MLAASPVRFLTVVVPPVTPETSRVDPVMVTPLLVAIEPVPVRSIVPALIVVSPT